MCTPSACEYNQDDEHVKMTRFKGISLGYDVKSNQKPIKNAPGPCEYNTINSKNNAVVKPTFNFKLQRGGIPAQKSSSREKEEMIAKTFINNGSPRNAKVNWAN